MKKSINIAFVFMMNCAFAQTADDVLNATQLSADKVMRDADFSLHTSPLIFNNGIEYVNLGIVGVGHKIIGLANLMADNDVEAYLGLSYTGNISIYNNGVLVYNGHSELSKITEYGHKKFKFQKTLNLFLSRGVEIHNLLQAVVS